MSAMSTIARKPVPPKLGEQSPEPEPEPEPAQNDIDPPISEISTISSDLGTLPGSSVPEHTAVDDPVYVEYGANLYPELLALPTVQDVPTSEPIKAGPEVTISSLEKAEEPLIIYRQIWSKPRTWSKRRKWIVAIIIVALLLIIIIAGAVGGSQHGGGVDCAAKPYGYGCHCWREPSNC